MAIGALRPLDSDEAWARLGGVRIGRLSVTVGSLPLIVPMGFRTHGENLVFGVDRGSSLVPALDGSVIAFEASGHHDDSQLWWTVLVRGTTQLLPEGHEVAVALDDPVLASSSRVVLAKPHLIAGGEVPSLSQTGEVASYLAQSHRSV